MTPAAPPHIAAHLPPHGWFRWHDQFADLLDKHRPKRCVEVGAWLGASALYTAERIKAWGGELVCVDPWGPWYLEDAAVAAFSPTAYERFCANVWASGLHEVITPIRGTSEDAGEVIPSVDWVYIDGSHEYRDVVLDLETWWPRLAKGGVMLGDDYGMEGVRQAWDEWKQRTGRTTQDVEGQLIWVVK